MIKKILLILFFLHMLFLPAFAEAGDYKDIDSMWELVSEYSPSDEITAAVVTAIHYESNCTANAVGGGYLLSDHYSEDVTAAIDAGLEDGSTREAFMKHCVDKKQCWGYGLLQWVDYNECGKLYDYAAECGTSIGDARTQVAFIFWNLQENMPEVWQKLLDAESAGDAGIVFAHWFVGTGDGLKLQDREWLAEELIKEHEDGNQG